MAVAQGLWLKGFDAQDEGRQFTPGGQVLGLFPLLRRSSQLPKPQGDEAGKRQSQDQGR